MLRFDGQKDFPAHAPALVWDKLSDARFLILCVPDVHEVTRQEREEAEFSIRPGLAFVRGTLQVTLKVVEAVSPSSIRLAMHSKGIGTTSDVEVSLTVAPLDQGTRIEWVAEVKQLGGLLKAVPHGLIRGAAQKVIADAWNTVERKLAS